MKMLPVCVAYLAAIATTLPAHAYSLFTCDGEPTKWLANSATLRIDTTAFPLGSPQRTEIDAGFQQTNQNPSPFSILLESDTGGVGIGNFENEAYMADIVGLAYYEKRSLCLPINDDTVYAHMWEIDIVFSSTYNWTLNSLKAFNSEYKGGARPIRVTATHESGHLLGLDHVSREYNVMGEAPRHLHTNGSTAHSYFGEDASDGAVRLYGTQSGSFEDVSASHWRYLGSDTENEYSQHARTRMFDSLGLTELEPVTSEGEPHYRVNRGQVVRAEFVLENNGKTTQNNVSFDIRLSDNATISAGDTLLTSGTIGSLTRNHVYPRIFRVTIPNNLTSGKKYWIGLRMDSNSTISEVDPSNNNTYIGIHVN